MVVGGAQVEHEPIQRVLLEANGQKSSGDLFVPGSWR